MLFAWSNGREPDGILPERQLRQHLCFKSIDLRGTKMTRMSLLIVLIIASGLSYAQDFGKSLNHVTVVVSDFEASKKFYTELLGLEQIDTPWLPDRQMFLAIGEGLELHVGEVEGVEIRPNGFNHFAIAVAEFDEFLQ